MGLTASSVLLYLYPFALPSHHFTHLHCIPVAFIRVLSRCSYSFCLLFITVVCSLYQFHRCLNILSINRVIWSSLEQLSSHGGPAFDEVSALEVENRVFRLRLRGIRERRGYCAHRTHAGGCRPAQGHAVEACCSTSRRLLRACMPARFLVTGVTSHKVACLLRRTRSTSPMIVLSLEGVRRPGSVLREPGSVPPLYHALRTCSVPWMG